MTPDLFTRAGRWIERNRGLALPAAVAGLVFVLIAPLPPTLIDVLLVANLGVSCLALMSVIQLRRPTEFSVFPSLLLLATLVRLVLNVATTRLILTAGGGADPAAARFAAGKVIWAFSEFVTAGSLAVGGIIFGILVVIQFIVITKGCGRISEVSARFMLDAMPGKQMAVDSELNAGLIDPDQARRRRAEISEEADFYGAMDGASKFLRGDAVAGVLITFVNILGGLYVGIVQHGWGWAASVDLFTRLTIGDGLVAQVPAFLLSVAAGLLITRSTSRTHLGEAVLGQLGSRPVVLGIAAALAAALMFTGLPKIPLLLMGSSFAGLAWMLSRRAKNAPADAPESGESTPLLPPPSDEPEKLLAVDPIRLELGYALVGLFDTAQPAPQGMLAGIAELRKQLACDLGLLVPPIRVRDDMRLSAYQYVIRLRGLRVAEGRLQPGQLLAVPVGESPGTLVGREAVDPVTGRDAVWIPTTSRGRAESEGYEVCQPGDVLLGHLDTVLRARAAELLTREQAARLLENLRPQAGHLVEEVTAKLPMGRIQKVLQNLLSEQVSIRDLETILEALSDAAEAGPARDVEELTVAVRAGLARTLAQQYCSDDGRLWCVRLDPQAELSLTSQQAGGPEAQGLLAPSTREMTQTLASHLAGLRQEGKRPVVLCSPAARLAVRKLLSASDPSAAVLATNEVQSVQVQSVSTVGTQP